MPMVKSLPEIYYRPMPVVSFVEMPACVLVIKRHQCETGILRYQSDKRRAIVMLNAIVFRAVYIRALDAGCWLIV